MRIPVATRKHITQQITNTMIAIGAAALGLFAATAANAAVPGSRPESPLALPSVNAPSISLVEAKRVMAMAQADAAKRKVPATIVIIDRYGELVLAEVAAEADGAAFDIALLKARSIVNYSPGTLVFDQQNPNGNMLPGATGKVGGTPLRSNGKIIGAIGVTGGAADDVARAGAAGAERIELSAAATAAPPAATAAPPAATAAPPAVPTLPAATTAPSATQLSAAPVAPYGPPITPDQARAVAAKVEVEKVRRGVDTAAIAVVDPAGRMVYFERQDNATFSNLEMAVRKARGAARLRRPTSVDAARLKAGELIILMVPDAFPADGGQPVVKNGQVIGAVGVAGGGDDATTALVGASALTGGQ